MEKGNHLRMLSRDVSVSRENILVERLKTSNGNLRSHIEFLRKELQEKEEMIKLHLEIIKSMDDKLNSLFSFKNINLN